MSTAESTAATKPFRIMDLPPELRLHIYDQIIPEHRFILVLGGLVYHDTSGKYNVGPARYAPGTVSLLRCCKTIHREALPVLFEKSTLYIQLWDAAVQARCHANSTIWKVLGNVADYAALRHAERVVLSVCSDEEADNAALRHTIEETLGGLDYCRSVKRLDITITVGTFLYTDIDQKGIDSLIDGFKSIECPGDITTEVEDENGGDFDRKNYQELVDKLKA